MKTQNTIDEQDMPAERGRSRGTSWFAGVGAVLVVALVIGASIFVFAQLGQQHKSQSPAPPGGKWIQVLNGYTLASLQAATSDPATLYACAVHSGTGNDTAYTILRSTDFGTHWQDIGSQANPGMSCQLAINPGNSKELYAIGIPDAAHPSSVLKHSLDGGQTWTTIQPVLYVSNINTAPAWNVEQLSMVGNSLFGVQQLPQATNPGVSRGALPKYYARLTRLVKSSDGGRTWTAVNQQFSAPWQGVSSYVVDPTNANVIYELVGFPWLPILPGKTEPNDNLPGYGTSSDLYKTTDGGATWQRLLQNIPFNSQLQLAKNKPQTIYVGGSGEVVPYLEKAPGADYPATNVPVSFHLQMSSDGGTTWRPVPDLPLTSQAPRLTSIRSWFVGSNGQVYAYSIGSPVSIQRYTSSTNAWSKVTVPPTSGILAAVTPGSTNGDVLWFMGTSKGQVALYRYVS